MKVEENLSQGSCPTASQGDVMKKTIYECTVCGVVSQAREQLCQPRPQSARLEYCGTSKDADTMCEATQKSIPFVCRSCGRAARQAELLCRPLVVDH